MENALSLVVLGVSVLIAASSLIFTTYLVNLGSDEVSTATMNAAQIITTEDADYAEVSGELTGMQVRELLQRYNDSGLYTLTITKQCPDGYYTAEGSEDSGSDHFIQDDASFTAELYRNENNVVVGVTFRQQGTDSVKFDYEMAQMSFDYTENNIITAQLKLFNQVRENQNLCLECIRSFGNLADTIKKQFIAEMDAEYRTVTGTVPDSSAYEVYINKFENQTTFYDTLTSCLQAWTRQGLFDTVIKPILDIYDYDDEDYWDNSDDEDSADSDSDVWDDDLESGDVNNTDNNTSNGNHYGDSGDDFDLGGDDLNSDGSGLIQDDNSGSLESNTDTENQEPSSSVSEEPTTEDSEDKTNASWQEENSQVEIKAPTVGG